MDGFILLVLIGMAIWYFRPAGSKPQLHAHGLTRAQVERHERRHRKALRRNKIGSRSRVWKTRDGWAGVTKMRSRSDSRRWAALGRDDQAAVFMVGAMGPERNAGCRDDLAAVDRLSTRARARRRARARQLL